MKPTTIIAGVLASLSATAVAQDYTSWTYLQYPSTGISCPTTDPNNPTAFLSNDELQQLAFDNKDGTPRESSAANASSGRCSTLRLPYFTVSVSGRVGSYGFAVDASANTIYFCSAQATVIGSSGYPEGCSAV